MGLSLQPTKVFAKAWLDNVASTMCKHQRWFGLDIQFSALVHNFNFVFSIGICTGQTSNEFPAFANTRTLAVTHSPVQ